MNLAFKPTNPSDTDPRRYVIGMLVSLVHGGKKSIMLRSSKRLPTVWIGGAGLCCSDFDGVVNCLKKQCGLHPGKHLDPAEGHASLKVAGTIFRFDVRFVDLAKDPHYWVELRKQAQNSTSEASDASPSAEAV